MILLALAAALALPQIHFQTPQTEVAPSSTIAVSVLLDSDSAVNAFDMEFAYPTDILEFVSAGTAHSVISLWRSIPWVLGNVVNVEGGTPGGWSGRGGLIAVLNFKALRAGKAEIFLRKHDVYYADGKGTKAEIATTPFQIYVKDKAPLVGSSSSDDKAPVVSGATIAENPFGDFELALFDIKEDESGLERIEARSVEWFTWSEWSVVPNPVGIERGVWALEVRVTDNNGNTVVKTFYVWKTLLRKVGYFVVLPIFLISALYFGLKLLRRRAVPATDRDLLQ